MGHADFDQYVAGRGETADLPAVHRHIVGQAVTAQGHAPERWGHDVFHVPGSHHFITVDSGYRWGFVDFFLADAGGMHVGFVGQVHQIVDHQAVVTADVKQPAAIGPVFVDGPLQVRNQVGISLRLIARPDPDKAIAFDHRVGLDARKPSDALPRHLYRLAVAAHHQAVIATHQVAVFDIAQRQRRAAVRAKIFHRSDATLLGAVERDLLPADLSAQGLIAEFVSSAGNIPGVFGVHEGSPASDCCYLMDPLNVRREVLVNNVSDLKA
ncbi:hypothetical protein D3C72_1261330 [compost metagenome]